MSVINSLKALIFFSTIIICGSFGFFFAVTPAIPFILLNRRIYFRWCSSVMGYFLLMVTCLLEDLFGIKIVVTGDNLTNDKKRSLIILNHRTRMDWMYIWMLHSRIQILEQLKIVLKAQIKHIPFIGWGIEHVGYLFLERRWEDDKDRIKNVINYYKSNQSPVSILIFPEGTNLSAKTKVKSNAYAAKQTVYNRPYEYCLHPRVTGFTYLLNTMRADNMIDTVDDITIGYEGNFPVTELDLLKGHLPKIVHFDVKRYNINEIPKEDEQIDQWLKTCWDEKENRLKEFYSKNQFNSSVKKFNDNQIEFRVQYQRRLATGARITPHAPTTTHR
jgi:lysocardiolipin and lysophospholipid acyltransferase